MNRVLVLFILLSNTAFGQDVLIWNENIKLSWDNFKGQPHDTTFAAATYCGIETRICKRSFWNGRIAIEVSASFYPDKSWYLNDKVHDLTLRHEQGHFDIAEWYARQLRKEISEKIKNRFQYELKFQKLYDANYAEYFQTQTTYERQTGSGTLTESQLIWEQKINLKLKELDDFKNNNCQ